MQGYVKCVKPEKAFGFIRNPDTKSDYFFHRNDTDDRLPFDESLQELAVEFTPVSTPKGPAAKNVRKAHGA